MSSKTSQAQSPTLSEFLTPTKYCYTVGDLAKISAYSKSCEKTKLDLTTMNQQYKACQDQASNEFIGSETIFWGSVAVALVTGFVVGLKVR